MQDDGSYVGGEEGYEAYVFPDAEIIKGTNYTCDDGVYFMRTPGYGTVTITYNVVQSKTTVEEDTAVASVLPASDSSVTVSASRRRNVKLGADPSTRVTDGVTYGRNEVGTIARSVVKANIAESTESVLYGVFTVSTNAANVDEYTLTTADTLSANTSYAVVKYTIKTGDINESSRSAEFFKMPAGSTSLFKDNKISSDAEAILAADKKIAARNIIKAAHSDYSATYPDLSTVKLVSVTDNVESTDLSEEGEPIKIKASGNKYTFTVYPTNDSVDETLTSITPSTDSGRDDNAGTHEYTYAEQVTMIFAKNQNLIDKRGVRYVFERANEMFGDLDFDSRTAAIAPGSQEPVVIVGLTGLLDEVNYELDDVKDYIKSLTEEYYAKAYDVKYSDYCELLVEDEMGYFDPQFLGSTYTPSGSTKVIKSFGSESDYEKFATAKKGIDFAISQATTWENGEHESINDAIDALRAKKLVIDTGEDNGISGIDKIHGGYKVTGLSGWGDSDSKKNYPTPAKSDVKYASNVRESDFEDEVYGSDGTYGDENYTFQFNSSAKGGVTDGTYGPYRSNYALEKVIEALSKLATKENIYQYVNDDDEVEIVVSATDDKESNRAIYVNVDGSVVTATGSYIYLLHNIAYKKLLTDRDGLFKFVDKKGNTLYYQDHIFAGTEYLALVIIGNKGLIFTVGRHGTKNFTGISWMVSNNGFVTNKQAETLVKAGLIHTVPHTEEGETFDATCTVADLAIRKVEKESKHYTPVLFLDTLKTSTIEQAAETTYATGGNGNANLIGWDYSKEITLTLEDALYSPASMNMMWGKADEEGGIVSGVKDVHKLDRFEKIKAKRNFIIPAGNQDGTPSEADSSVQTVYYNPATMEPFQDGTPIAEGEVVYKWTRTVAYDDNSLGRQIEISADGFPGTYRIVGETYARMYEGGKDQRFQFEICEAKIGADGMAITLEADGDPAVNVDCHNTNAAVKCV